MATEVFGGEHVSLQRFPSGVFVLTMLARSHNPENRWTLPFVIEMAKVFDLIETTLESDQPGTPAALLTVSNSPKFFSNGIDPAWRISKDTSEEDIKQWDDLIMACFVRPLLLPIPTICAIGGHAFGAGMMFALGHDQRLQATERGFMCAIEIAIGFPIPPPELTLFRHCMSTSAFHQTVLQAKRWTAEEAQKAGIVQQAVPRNELFAVALKEAEGQAKLVPSRSLMNHFKRELKGYVVEEVFDYCYEGGKTQSSRPIPPGLRKHLNEHFGSPNKVSWGSRFKISKL
jgi:enoyl-CoA hydratase/carnithine racemase